MYIVLDMYILWLYMYIVFVGEPMAGMPGAQVGSVPVIRMYGVTQDGNSVMCHVHGFASYLFTPAPEGFQDENCHKFRVSTHHPSRSKHKNSLRVQ